MIAYLFKIDPMVVLNGTNDDMVVRSAAARHVIKVKSQAEQAVKSP